MDPRKASRSQDRLTNDQDRRHRDASREHRTVNKASRSTRREASINRHDDHGNVENKASKPVVKKASTTTTKRRTSDVDTMHRQSTSTASHRLQTDDTNRRRSDARRTDAASNRSTSKVQSTSSKSIQQMETDRIAVEKSKRRVNISTDESTIIGKSKDRSKNNNDVVLKSRHDPSKVSSKDRPVGREINRSTTMNVQPQVLLKSDSKPIADLEKAEEDGNEYEEDFEDYESDFEEVISDENGNDDEHEEQISNDDADDEGDAEHLIVSRADPVSHESVEQFSNKEPLISSTMDEASFSKEEVMPSTLIPFLDHVELDERQTVVQIPNYDKLEEKELNLDKEKRDGHEVTIKSHDNNGVAIKSRSKNKTTKRGEELLDLIKLDDVGFSLFSLPPRTYDEFMRNFGSDNSKQAYTQTGDENDVQETQTDLVELTDVWTQHPPGIHGAVGGELLTSKQTNPYEITSSKDWKRLGRFLYQASQIICSLLEEEHSEAQNSKLVSVEKEISFSEKTLHLRPPLILRGYSAIFVSCCRLQPHFILVIYANNSPEHHNVVPVQKKIMCVWNVRQPSAPQKVLTTSCQSICCCFSNSAEFAFAGLEDGSVAVWDLREPDSLHQRFLHENEEYVFRSPTYSTAEVLRSDGHLSPVVAIMCKSDNYSSTSHSDAIIQLATLEEDGILCVWVLTETAHPDAAGDETDLGLAPGGKVQLVRSSSTRLQSIPKLQQHLQNYPRVKDFACQVQNANQFYVTTDTGVVVTCAAHDEKSTIFVPSEGTSATAEANSISFAVYSEQECFLVGCSDGSVRLHSVDKSKPLMTWTAAAKAGEAIHKVAWSESCPNVFYLLDSLGQVHVWDLCESDCEPASSTNAANKRVRHFDVGNDPRLWNETDTNCRPYVVFGCDDGTTEVHYVNEHYTRRGDKEKEMFKKYMELL